ncbi:MAG: PhnD/SsuA/transferrin family substrate-binding protein [Myxococcales bacterium]|nr:PhnD/SsuA/transferrin family substrate-binding protein [Myxococcales bacterium]
MTGEDQGEFEVPTHLSVGIALTTDPQMTRGLLEQLCLALGDATGIQVSPSGVVSYQRLVEQLAAREVDLVWLPPVPALRATAAGHLRPIALPIRNGESSYRTALFTRPDSPIVEPRDLVGRRAAWVDPESAAGYLIIAAHLGSLGLDPLATFADQHFLGSHDAVAAAVREGRADVGATFAYQDDKGRIRRAGWGSDRVRVICQAGPIPNDMLAARVGLSDLLVRMVQSALVDVQNAELREAARSLLAAEGFAVPDPEHLAPLRRLLSSAMTAPPVAHSMFPPPA